MSKTNHKNTNFFAETNVQKIKKKIKKTGKINYLGNLFL